MVGDCGPMPDLPRYLPGSSVPFLPVADAIRRLDGGPLTLLAVELGVRAFATLPVDLVTKSTQRTYSSDSAVRQGRDPIENVLGHEEDPPKE
ncbi:hypothetical protein ADL09_24540 [Streptomyces sp. NRRL F-7442]|nr:hypothetical protein ADL09_24540 [Streptomyces sp. NRRL F-7442]